MKYRIARKIIRYLYRDKHPVYRWHTLRRAMDIASHEWHTASCSIRIKAERNAIELWASIAPGRSV